MFDLRQQPGEDEREWVGRLVIQMAVMGVSLPIDTLLSLCQATNRGAERLVRLSNERTATSAPVKHTRRIPWLSAITGLFLVLLAGAILAFLSY